MIVYRIGLNKYIDDLSGEGARLYGGRWNHKGDSMLYTAQSSSLAMLELLVHTEAKFLTSSYFLLQIKLDDNLAITQIKEKQLPEDWQGYPAPFQLQEIGSRWILEAKTPLLRVPSAVNPMEHNVLINPRLVKPKQIQILNKKPISIDQRFYQSKY